MSGTGVHHLSFAVTNLDKTVDFYRNILGFTLRSKFTNRNPGLGRGLFGAEWDETGEEAWLELAEMELRGNRIEFVEYVHPRTKPSRRDPTIAGSAHLAIRVQNIERERAKLQAAGVRFLSSTGSVEENDRSFWKWCQFLDPDGIVVELVEEVPTERRLLLIADRIKKARLARGLTLQEVSDRGDFSAAHLSQIERGQSVPSVGTLLSIATALDFPADLFLKEDGPGEIPSSSRIVGSSGQLDAADSVASFSVVPQGGLSSIQVAGGIEWVRLNNSGPVEFTEVHYDVGAAGADVAYQEKGFQCGLVIEGSLLLELGFSRHRLEPGESVVYDRSTPHRLSNIGEVPARAIWATLLNS